MKSKTRLISVRFIMKTIVLFSFLSIFSCSQNETTNDAEKVNNKEMNFDNLRIDLGDWNFKTDSIILFQANNLEELNNHLNTSFTYFIEGLDQIVRTNEKIDVYEFNLRFHQGEAMITDIVFYNSITGELVDGFETGNTVSCVQCSSIGDLLFGACPSGYTNNGVCLSEPCVKTTVAEILAPLADGNGCRDIRVSRGSWGVRICSRTC